MSSGPRMSRVRPLLVFQCQCLRFSVVRRVFKCSFCLISPVVWVHAQVRGSEGGEPQAERQEFIWELTAAQLFILVKCYRAFFFSLLQNNSRDYFRAWAGRAKHDNQALQVNIAAKMLHCSSRRDFVTLQIYFSFFVLADLEVPLQSAL